MLTTHPLRAVAQPVGASATVYYRSPHSRSLAFDRSTSCHFTNPFPFLFFFFFFLLHYVFLQVIIGNKCNGRRDSCLICFFVRGSLREAVKRDVIYDACSITFADARWPCSCRGSISCLRQHRIANAL
uniref:Uncharacterized protein n=1 Tax=Trypanosoma congolense (strain IL3000) TaxID=1068625 RepID=G0US63_TRYCI|nr:hypothetical protein, unlikely [Trypanosoma congolense IL3000]